MLHVYVIKFFVFEPSLKSMIYQLKIRAILLFGEVTAFMNRSCIDKIIIWICPFTMYQEALYHAY